MIEVYGKAKLEVDFNVEFDMTEEEFEALSERQQDALIDSAINWHSTLQSAEVDEFDVYEYYEIKK